jgi:hypothetical protein
VKDLTTKGVWANAPDGQGYVLLHPSTGLMVTDKDGNPYRTTMMDLMKSNDMRKPDVQEGLDPMGFPTGEEKKISKLGPVQMEVGQKIVNSFLSKGYTQDQAHGMASNLYRESALDPYALGDGGTSFGLGQWRGDRKAALYALSKSKGETTPSVETQIEFIHQELSGSENKAGEVFKTAKNEREAADALMVHYERPKEVRLNQSPLLGALLSKRGKA